MYPSGDLYPEEPVPYEEEPNESLGVGVYSPKVQNASVTRRFVSLGGQGYVSLAVIRNGNDYIDADADSVSFKLWYHTTLTDFDSDDPRGRIVLTMDDHTDTVDRIQREDIGRYFYNIGPQWTQKRGVLTVEWTYSLNGEDYEYTDYLQILDPMPTYDTLSDQSKFVIESATWSFGDLFDSTEGGAWLQENFQTKFSYERLAHLLFSTVGRINLTGQPPTNYGVFPTDQAVPREWTSLLVWGLRLEVIRHLMRSYTEIPDFRNMSNTYTDRRDYAQRWKMILDDEKPDFEKAIIVAKRQLLSLSRGSLIVAGGFFGGGGRGGLGMLGMSVAAQRSFRFYPSAPSIQWSNRIY